MLRAPCMPPLHAFPASTETAATRAVHRDGDCAFKLMEHREYLPSPHVLAASRTRAQDADPLTADLLARITALQHSPESCARAREAHFPNHGAAATMNYLIIQLKRGLRDQRPVIFSGTWIYAGCVAQDMSCIFLRETVCNASLPVHSCHGTDTRSHDWALQSHGVNEALGGSEHGGAYPQRVPEVDPDFVLPVYQAEGKGVFWYNSVITGYLFRLTPALSRRVEEEVHLLGLVHVPFIGVQVRF